MRRTICGLGFCLVFGLMVGCAQTGQYTSKDLTVLPCESKANEVFFPLEFDDTGKQRYKDQAETIKNALDQAERVLVFVHGWNKTPDLAERDYQDLICRFYTHSKRDEASAKRSIIIGVFWPSADFPPLLNFWRMKNRADDLAFTGFQSLIELLATPASKSGGHYDLVFIGHSFGGRIILKGISHYIAQLTPEKYRFLSSLNQLQLVLLTAAIGEDSILRQFLGGTEIEDHLEFKREWDSQAFLQEMVTQYGREFTHEELLMDVLHIKLQWRQILVTLSGLTDFRVYNIFSTHDAANRFLYPIGSLMEGRWPACAIGACGVFQWPDLVSATSAGSLGSEVKLAQSNLWNVDASKVIFSHTDIYKGRIANLLWELIDLPHPQYAESVMPKDIRQSSSYSLEHNILHKEVARFNRQKMKEINDFRQLGEAGLKAVNELSTLAFAVDEELRKENWVAAEEKIRKIAELKYFYLGWSVQVDWGLIEKGLLFDFSAVRAEWTPLNEVSIHLLLAFVLAKQDKCDDASQEARMGIGVAESLTVTEGWLISWNIQPENFLPDRIRMLNCHK